ncbi:MAG: serine/threonine protein kinase [Gemmatimonadota bacterium]|jgi:predicted Ser/Thr protein kinase|nr:serine/threonine protein kinase [Gemmatimonadota bacterium]
MLQQAVAGRFAVERELGRGGMGVVFLARDLTLDRPVAIKLLAPALAADSRARERFLREARAAARLSHPHIVPIHSVEDHGGVVFFVMAYVEGETLGQRVRRAGPLPRAQASRIMQEVTWALGMAHALGLVHRDVKPDNILLERATGRALVMDFGIAHFGEGPVKGTDARAGTPHYMSPEQAAGDPVDGRSDIYSLGVTMFFALTGERPFEEVPTPAALLAGTVVAPTVLSLRPDLPLPFAAAIDRCLSPDPATRFSSAEELAAAVVAARPAGDQTPAPVAGWVMDAQAAGAEIGTAVVTAAVSAGVMGVVGFDSIAGFIFYPISALLTGMGLFRFGDLVLRTRQLRQQGYGLESVAPALTLEQRRIEEEATLLGKAPAGPFDIPIVFLATTAAKTALSVWLLNSSIDWLNVIGAAGTVLFPASAVRHLSRRWPRAQTFWSRMLSGRLGKFLFWVADRWPGSTALPAPDAPTAVLLGGAADRLYRALPPPRQAEFGELPALLRRLEADALAAGDTNPARRGAALSALEAIRLDLLRMQAGDAVADQLTEDLGAARRLADRVDQALEDGTR